MAMLFNPRAEQLPRRSELPTIPGAPIGAAWFWGPDDEVRISRLTYGSFLLYKCNSQGMCSWGD